MSQPENLLASLFRYKLWANSEILAVARTVDAAQNANERHAIIRILNHTYVVDRIFAGHLTNTPHQYSATNTEETPSLDDLAASISQSDAWYLDYVAGLSCASVAEQMRFQFTDGETGSMTRQEMLMHVVNHGSYHRGAAGRILAQLSIAPPKDTFTAFLHQAEPQRRI
ncbi:MAG: DinB family protein [Pseudomonadota bacterium]